jgi:hypothetical protein
MRALSVFTTTLVARSCLEKPPLRTTSLDNNTGCDEGEELRNVLRVLISVTLFKSINYDFFHGTNNNNISINANDSSCSSHPHHHPFQFARKDTLNDPEARCSTQKHIHQFDSVQREELFCRIPLSMPNRWKTRR